MPPTLNWEYTPSAEPAFDDDGAVERYQHLSIEWDKPGKWIEVLEVDLAGTNAKSMDHKEFIGFYRPDGHDDERVIGFRKVDKAPDGELREEGDETIKLGVLTCTNPGPPLDCSPPWNRHPSQFSPFCDL